jgi:hypothetical protein
MARSDWSEVFDERGPDLSEPLGSRVNNDGNNIKTQEHTEHNTTTHEKNTAQPITHDSCTGI